MKKILTLVVIGLTTTIFGQNVDFKSANFKDDKEGLKAATTAIDKGNEFYKIGMDAVFAVQDFGTNFVSALKEYEKAQKFNPNNALINYKIGVCHANSTNPVSCIEYFKTAQKLDPKCDPFLNFYLGYASQLEGKYDEASKYYTAFETEYKKADNFMKFVNQRKKQCVTAKKFEASPVRCWVDNVPSLNTDKDEIAPSISTDGSEMILSSNRPNSHEPNALGIYDYEIYSSSLLETWSTPASFVGVDHVSNSEEE